MLCIRNFWPILLVVRDVNRSQIVTACFKRSQIYSLFKCMYLHGSMRLQSLRKDPRVAPDTL